MDPVLTNLQSGFQVNASEVLDRRLPEPLHVQIKKWMLQEIESGNWPIHYKLPAEEDLARHLGVSRGTARQAIQELIKAHRLKQIHGRGTFVINRGQIEGEIANRLIAFSEDLLLQDIPFRTEVMEQRVRTVNARVSGLLGTTTDTAVLVLKRRRHVDGIPIVLTHNYVRVDVCPGIEEQNFNECSLFECLERKYSLHLSWARRTVEAQAATAQVAKALHIRDKAPVLYMEQIVYLESGQAVECSDIWLRGDRFKLSSIISRSNSDPTAASMLKKGEVVAC